jgi:uncharacterized membrane protein
MTKRQVIALLAVAGACVSLYLLLYKLGYIGTLSCSIGSCETVNTSKWSYFLGLPVAAYGLAFYIATLVVAIVGMDREVGAVLVAMSAAGVLFSLYLTGLELFVIHAICMWCVTSAIIVTVIFVTSLLDYREATPA